MLEVMVPPPPTNDGSLSTQPVALPISRSLSLSFYGSSPASVLWLTLSVLMHVALLRVWLPNRPTRGPRPEPLNPWREAAFCICMALSGVTCYPPPPPSATIEAIEALEPHDEDREGKPALHLQPPLSTYGSGFSCYKCHNQHTQK